MKCTMPPIIAAMNRSSVKYQLIPNAVSDGAVRNMAMIEPLRNNWPVGIIFGVLLSFIKFTNNFW